MGQLLLVRHGQASWGAENYDVLSPLGHEQARLLGESFASRSISPDASVIGSMERHRDTLAGCASAAGWTATPSVDADWDEYDHVALLAKVPAPDDASTDKRAFQQWIEAGTDRWTGGEHDDYAESFADFGARVDRAFAALPTDGTTVVVSSGGPISWVVAGLLASEPGARTDLWRRLNVVCANSGVTRVIAGRRGRTLVSFNEHTHLDGVEGALSYR